MKRVICVFLTSLLLFAPSLSFLSYGAETNETIIYNFLKTELRLNEAQACGVLANIYGESRFDPHAYLEREAVDGKPSYGLCQWHLERLDGLIGYCGDHGLDYTTVQGQLEYLKYELYNTEKHAFEMLLECDNTADGAYLAGYNWSRYYGRGAAYLYEYRGNLSKDKFWPVYGEGASTVTYSTISEGVYYVKNNAANKYLTVASHVEQNGEDCTVGTASANDYYKIRISAGSKGYIMKPLFTSTSVVNIYATIVDSGKRVTLYTPTGHDSQAWYFEITEGGYAVRSVQRTDFVLDLNGDKVIVKTYSGAASQSWSLVPADLPETVTPVVAPGKGGEETFISWTAAPHADSYEIVVKNSSGTAVLTDATPEDSYVCVLDEGSYTVYLTSVNTALQGIGTYKSSAASASFTVQKKHVHDFSGAVETVTPAGCVTPGTLRTYCSDTACGEYVESEIPPTGHSSVTSVAPPTLEADGALIRTCAVCGEQLEYQMLPANERTVVFHSREAVKGGTVSVPVSISGFTGVSEFTFRIDLSDDSLMLEGVRRAEGTGVTADFADGNVTLTFSDSFDGSGLLLLKFIVGNTGSDNVAVNVAYDESCCRLTDGASVYPSVGGASVTIVDRSHYYGDVNSDGAINMKDVLALRKYMLNIVDYLSFSPDKADVNGDGSIDMKDVLQIRKFILHIITSFPASKE
ncbi:MAG: hypothetical protein IJT70_02620 [Clostridia bacterium]|nr:hypothetical protein [Clostridia bacterium]